MSDKEILKKLDIGGTISANDMIVKQYKEIERLIEENQRLKEAVDREVQDNTRLNNIITELEKWLEEQINLNDNEQDYIGNVYSVAYSKLKELKGSDNK